MVRMRVVAAFTAAVVVILFAGCSGGTVPSLTGPATASVAPGATSQVSLPQNLGISGTLTLVTAPSWPSGVTATISAVSGGAPAPQSAHRMSTSPSALATWKLTFSGSTSTGNLA